MPRRQLLSEKEKETLTNIPTDRESIVKFYTLSEHEIHFVKHTFRGATNRLGAAVQIAYMKYPGIMLKEKDDVNKDILNYLKFQLDLDANLSDNIYEKRDVTRREHAAIIRAAFGFTTFPQTLHADCVQYLTPVALQSEKGIVIARELMEYLRQQKVLIPSINVIERLCAETITKAEKITCRTLISSLTKHQITQINNLLNVKDGKTTATLTWLKEPPAAVNSKHLLIHVERLESIENMQLPENLEKKIHRNKLLKLSREGRRMTVKHLKDLAFERRIATLTAMLIDIRSLIIDEIVDLHDRIIGSVFKKAKDLLQQQVQSSSKDVNDQLHNYMKLGTAIINAKESGTNLSDAIEAAISMEELKQSIANMRKLIQPESFDHLHYIGNKYMQIHRYTPALLNSLELQAAPVAAELMDAINVLKQVDTKKIKELPHDAPTSFIRKRWEPLIFKENNIDRKFYELCVMSELKNRLRSGDIWIKNSYRFKDFEDYLLPLDRYDNLIKTNEILPGVDTNPDRYLSERIELLNRQLEIANRLFESNRLEDVTVSGSSLTISPVTNSVPEEAEQFAKKIYALLPHVKITDLLMEVDVWSNFTGHFTHLKSGEQASDKTMLLTTILADAINLGLSKMAESSPATTYARLSWLQAWYIRDETYSTALASLVNAQSVHPIASYWGDGKKSSSDGQRFATGSHAQELGKINPKYGNLPGIQFYTHISDQYAPFHTKVINVGVRDATYVLDGLLYHESDLNIEEHYTDTSGFTDHVFALMHLLGFRFAPRIRDLSEKKLYVPSVKHKFESLTPFIGGAINIKQIRSNWDNILRLAASIQKGVVTASLMVRKIGSYPRQNGLAIALRELGRIERTLFMLNWYMDPQLRRKVNAGLNKGEARNALARALYFNRLGEVRDRSFEIQCHKSGGLNLATAAVVLWNTVYLERVIEYLKNKGEHVDEKFIQYLSPLGWEHIQLTGDYVWQPDKLPDKGKFRPLRSNDNAIAHP